MAELGFRKFDDMIGQIKVLDQNAINHWKAEGLDFSKLFFDPHMGKEVPIFNCEKQTHPIDNVLDRKLINLSQDALEKQKRVKLKMPIKNYNRSTGSMLSGEVARLHGHAGLPEIL